MGLAAFVNVFNQEVVGVVGVMEAGELILEAARRKSFEARSSAS